MPRSPASRCRRRATRRHVPSRKSCGVPMCFWLARRSSPVRRRLWSSPPERTPRSARSLGSPRPPVTRFRRFRKRFSGSATSSRAWPSRSGWSSFSLAVQSASRSGRTSFSPSASSWRTCRKACCQPSLVTGDGLTADGPAPRTHPPPARRRSAWLYDGDLTDKTGTLTRNLMSARRLFIAGEMMLPDKSPGRFRITAAFSRSQQNVTI